jgi:predicted acyltransferase
MPKRLLSLDVMRGLIMILLAAESTSLYSRLDKAAAGSWLQRVTEQFFHHDWHGLRFWDLIQPGFMTMAGSAMFLSFYFKQQKGVTWKDNLPHILFRCLKLFLFGTALHCVYSGKMVWELWNVLTQLAFTTLIAYLIIRKSYLFQLIVSFGLILLSEVLYRTVLVGEFNQPFVMGKNFGSYTDMLVMGKINSGGWVFVNFIPTSAHTIWGVLAGKLLVDDRFQARQKLRYLIASGIVLLLVGYAADLGGLSPIIKRICTGSFVLVSGGWVLLFMTFLYWLTDIRQANRYAWIFSVVGMNAIFIYLLFETVGHQWLNGVVAIFVQQPVLASLVTLFILWYLCFFLYKKKVFFKL